MSNNIIFQVTDMLFLNYCVLVALLGRIQTVIIFLCFLFLKMDITPPTKIVNEHASMTQRDIAKECGVSLGDVNKILKQKRDTGTIEVNRKGKYGRKIKTTARDGAFLVRESKLNPRKPVKDVLGLFFL